MVMLLLAVLPPVLLPARQGMRLLSLRVAASHQAKVPLLVSPLPCVHLHRTPFPGHRSTATPEAFTVESCPNRPQMRQNHQALQHPRHPPSHHHWLSPVVLLLLKGPQIGYQPCGQALLAPPLSTSQASCQHSHHLAHGAHHQSAPHRHLLQASFL